MNKHWFSSFRTKLTLIFGMFAVSFGIIIVLYVNYVATNRMTLASGEALHSMARTMAYVLANTLTEREREIRLLSASSTLSSGDVSAAHIRPILDGIKHSYRYYSWLGVADPSGHVTAAADGLLEGKDVTSRPWFIHGQQGSYIGDVHEAVLLAKILPPNESGEPWRFVDFAAPIHDRNGQLRGVVAAHADWSWVKNILERTLPEKAAAAGIEVLVIDQDGDVLYPLQYMHTLHLPADLSSAQDLNDVEWGDGARYLSSYELVQAETTTHLGWRVVVRQPLDKALHTITDMHRNLIILGILFTTLAILLSYSLATSISRPVEQLSIAAKSIQYGDRHADFSIASSTSEIQILSAALHDMTATLLASKAELRHINATLEHKVQERTQALEDSNQKLEQLARRDPLTGLYNRRAANEFLHKEFLRMQRSGDCFAVIMLDIDYFKRVNDTHGHDVGDAVLQHVAAILHDSVRATDMVARFGGEEFLILLPDIQTGLMTLAEKIRTAIEGSIAPVVGQVTASLGAAIAQAQDNDASAATRRADLALYQAKAAGRNRVVLSSS